MYRTFVIIRHSFFEAIVQPIYSLLVALAAAILLIFGALPFFTLGEDVVMYKTVGLDVILLFILIATLFATSRSIYDEIEDRTMLTLMSKPLRKWEVLLGKYLGIVLAMGVATVILGVVITICTWARIPQDYNQDARSLDETVQRLILDYRLMHIAGLIPSLVLAWLEICVLAAIGVALSTRFSLVVNLPIVVILYVAGNLTRFLFPIFGPDSKDLWGDTSIIWKLIGYVFATVLPFLQTFDLRQETVYGQIAVRGTQFADDVNAVTQGMIWQYVGVAAIYAVCYVAFALSFGLLMFQSRELGGAEG